MPALQTLVRDPLRKCTPLQRVFPKSEALQTRSAAFLTPIVRSVACLQRAELAHRSPR
jgi:hypothetical protein